MPGSASPRLWRNSRCSSGDLGGEVGQLRFQVPQNGHHRRPALLSQFQQSLIRGPALVLPFTEVGHKEIRFRGKKGHLLKKGHLPRIKILVPNPAALVETVCHPGHGPKTGARLFVAALLAFLQLHPVALQNLQVREQKFRLHHLHVPDRVQVAQRVGAAAQSTAPRAR